MVFLYAENFWYIDERELYKLNLAHLIDVNSIEMIRARVSRPINQLRLTFYELLGLMVEWV